MRGTLETGNMALKRMDNVGIVVEDLDAAIDAYRLCYIRGPERIAIGLAQELS
jgi:hypothetical protein